jgi:hypothetical protein
MAKQLIRKVSEYVHLYRDPKTGIAWVENGSTGNGHTCHASIDATGSVKGMKKLGYWRKDDKTVRSHGYIYNIDSYVVSDDLDLLAAEYCRCGGKH